MLLWILKISCLAYLGFGLYLYAAQRSFMYFPVPENHADDISFEYLDSEGESIKVWILGPLRDSAIIYFGGNAEDVYNNAPDFLSTLPEHTVYLVNYRGFGGSSGSPTQANLFFDALNVYDALSPRHSRISVIGRSLGSGIATYLASVRPVQRLILATPHDSALAIAQRMYPVYPVSILLKDKYESVEYAPRITAPTLIITAERDHVIPRKHSIRLAQAFAPELVKQVVIANAGHNGLAGYRQYWDEIEAFLALGSADAIGYSGLE